MPRGRKTDMGHGRTWDLIPVPSQRENISSSWRRAASSGDTGALGKSSQGTSRWVGHVWINTKHGNEISQLLLHTSKRRRRRRRANREIQIGPPGTSQSSKQS